MLFDFVPVDQPKGPFRSITGQTRRQKSCNPKSILAPIPVELAGTFGHTKTPLCPDTGQTCPGQGGTPGAVDIPVTNREVVTFQSDKHVEQ